VVISHARRLHCADGLGLYFRYPWEQMRQLTTWSHMVRGEYICGIELGNAW
jgi:hypothetical protein